jgi:hypothetical protein
MTTPILALRELAASQAQPELVVNEALRRLEALVQCSVIDRDLATPPGSPAEGARYIVAASPTGAWAGQAGKIASFSNGGWLFATPVEGWLAYAQDENALLFYSGSAWAALTTGGGGGGGTQQFYGVLTRTATAPGSPSNGDQHLVTVGSGAFSGQDDKIAVRAAGAWTFVSPTVMQLVWVNSESKLYRYSTLDGWLEVALGGGSSGGGGVNPASQWSVPADPDLISPFTSGFQSRLVGTGAAASVNIDGNNSGVVTLNPGSTSTGHAGIILSNAPATATYGLVASGAFQLDAYVLVSAGAPSSTQLPRARVGIFPLLDEPLPSEGAFFFTKWNAGQSAVCWSCSVGGSVTDTNTVATGGYQHLEITYNSSTFNFDFKVGGTTIASISAGGPPPSGCLAAQCARTGTTGTYEFRVDVLRAQNTLSFPRW